MKKLKITGLFVYPVKSMKGIEIGQARLTPKGLQHDRSWMVVRSNGRFVTQRELPRMCLIQTGLDESGLSLSMKGHGTVTVPFDHADGRAIETKVWNDACLTKDQGEQVSRWLNGALGSDDTLRLVRMDPGYTRPLSQPTVLGEETTTGFADAAPFLVANEASLEYLNKVLESRSLNRVPMNRFRPNIVVQGLDPFSEHKLDVLSAQNYQLNLCIPCKRCIITTIDQETAGKDPQIQPFKTLQEINPGPGGKKAPAFAQYATLSRGDGEIITLGDHFKVGYP